jgi:hypothetical protein
MIWGALSMSTDDPILSKEILLRAFARLDELLKKRNLTADVFVFGGAAIVLGFDARPLTRDVDAVWKPHTEVLSAAREVADEFGLPRWWLNEQASFYLPAGAESDGVSAFTGGALRVTTAKPELLLAMKVRAARTGDREDIRLLANHLGLRSAVAVLALAEAAFGASVPDRQRLVVEDLFPDS